MAVNANTVWERAVATHSAMLQVQPLWAWVEMTPAAFQGHINALQTQRDTVAQLEAAQDQARGNLDKELDKLDLLTTQGKAAAKYRFRNMPDKQEVLDGLQEIGSGRSATLEEAREFDAAWEKLDATWTFALGVPLIDYRDLRADCETLFETYSKARAAWREGNGKLTTMVSQLNDHNVAWYDAAIRIFPEDSAEGAMIRSTIPIYTSPPATPEPPPTP